VNDEAHSHSPFLRRIRPSTRRDEPGEEVHGGEPLSPAEPAAAREGLHQALIDIGERVDEIIAGAERAAEDVRRRAQADADRYLTERRRRADALEAERNRRFQDALDALRSGVSRIEDESERVVRTVQEAISSSDEPADQAPEEPVAAPAPAPAPAAPPPAPVAYPGSAGRRGDGEPRADDVRVSMLIRATQLAVQGHDRGEIEQTLQTEFGATDAPDVVDQVLGRR
jgi:hypothetical protein